MTGSGSTAVAPVVDHPDLADRGPGKTRDPAPPRWKKTTSQGWKPPVVEPGFGIVVGRFQGTVVVTVHGEVDPIREARLGHILADLIDGQGNLSLVVDLHDATISDDERATMFADAVGRAARRGGTVTLDEAPLRSQRGGAVTTSCETREGETRHLGSIGCRDAASTTPRPS